jgi:ketosteroid isomerase-like protein
MDTSLSIQHIHQEYQAFCDGDFDAMGRLLADEVVWHVAGGGTAAGDKQGRTDVLDFLRSVADATGGNFRIQVHDVLTNNEHIVVLSHVTCTRDTLIYRADEVHVFHIDDDGLIHEAWGFTAEPGGQGAFWF